MKLRFLLTALAGLTACSNPAADEAATDAAAVEDSNPETALLPDYVARINSNDLDTVMAGFTDDVVFQAPNMPEIVGKAALRSWVADYLSAYETSWEKTALETIFSGGYAIERYAYKSLDTDKQTGAVHSDTGKGMIIYRQEDDGQWRVAWDSWNSDLPAVPAGNDAAAAGDGGEARALAESVYAAVAAGDMATFAGLMAPDIVWNEAEGNPYEDKNPYIGPDAVMTGLFSRLGEEWEDFSATPQEYVVDGDRVVVFGRYKETYKATGVALDIPFVHSWTVKDGKFAAFQQYTNTAALVAAMNAE